VMRVIKCHARGYIGYECVLSC